MAFGDTHKRKQVYRGPEEKMPNCQRHKGTEQAGQCAEDRRELHMLKDTGNVGEGHPSS